MSMSQLEIIKNVVDSCSKSQLESVFAPITDLPISLTKAEKVSHCLNLELGAYGFKTYVTPDKAAVYVDDQGMSKVVDFFKEKGYKPVLTEQQTERVVTLVDFANKNNVDLLWAQEGWKKKYYYVKQYGFNGFQLHNVLTLNTINSAAASLSPVGAAGLTITGVVALSWTGSLFLSTVENYIPATWSKTRLLVSGAKFGMAIPIRLVEWTTNNILGAVETVIFGRALPTNTSEVFKLNVGPELKQLAEVKKPILNWLIEQLKKWNN